MQTSQRKDHVTERQWNGDAALITQMRAGTHYMCAALRVALEATLHRPDRERQFIIMDDDYIRRGLHETDNIVLPAPRAERNIYFCHYYHPQTRLVLDKPGINLIGFPPDSFYSDGVVANHATNDPAPSGPRANSFVMRFDSPEWRYLEGRMKENAEWLNSLAEDGRSLIVRYEDLIANLDQSAKRLEEFLGEFSNPLPRPTKNARRTYWTEDYAAAFDKDALRAMWGMFGNSIERFYPERSASLRAAL
jgi:hypothetical protein